MRKLHLLCFAALVSCSGTESSLPADSGGGSKDKAASLAGKVFYFSSQNSDSACSITPNIDGGDREIAFPDSVHFFLVGYFKEETTLEKGRYNFYGTKLVLHTDSLRVSRANRLSPGEMKEEKMANQPDEVRVRSIYARTDTLDYGSCPGGAAYLVFPAHDDVAALRGIATDTAQFSVLLKRMQEQGLWEKLRFPAPGGKR